MKKSFTFFLAAVAVLSTGFLSSCSSDEPAAPPVPATDAVAASRSIVDAQAIALALAQGRDGESRFGSEVFIDNVVALTATNSRSGSDTLIYAVNYADNQGFALIAAPMAAEPIIGYAEQGSFDEATAAENPGFSFYLDAAKSYASSKINAGGGISIDPSKPIETTQNISPRIWVSWGQRYPEGMYCSNGLSGCTMTAMIQMMSYLEKPKSINYTFPGRDIQSETLNWTSINHHVLSLNEKTFTNNEAITSHLSTCEANEAIHKTIGRICRQLGYLNHANYKVDGTGASEDSARITFRALLPQNNISSVASFNSGNYESLFDYMARHNAVMMVSGFDNEIGKKSRYGHTWVCDGGQRIIVSQRVALEGGGYQQIEISRKTYFHYNWGWMGNCDGYFLAGVFDPDNKTANGSGAYKYDVIYFYVEK